MDDEHSENPKAAVWRANLDRLIRASGTIIEEESSLMPGEFDTYLRRAKANQRELTRLFEGRSLEYWRARRAAARAKREAREVARMKQ